MERRCWKSLLFSKEKEAELKDIEIFLSLREMLIEHNNKNNIVIGNNSAKNKNESKETEN